MKVFNYWKEGLSLEEKINKNIESIDIQEDDKVKTTYKSKEINISCSKKDMILGMWTFLNISKRIIDDKKAEIAQEIHFDYGYRRLETNWQISEVYHWCMWQKTNNLTFKIVSKKGSLKKYNKYSIIFTYENEILDTYLSELTDETNDKIDEIMR